MLQEYLQAYKHILVQCQNSTNVDRLLCSPVYITLGLIWEYEFYPGMFFLFYVRVWLVYIYKIT